jgi:hypothetical protein
MVQHIPSSCQKEGLYIGIPLSLLLFLLVAKGLRKTLKEAIGNCWLWSLIIFLIHMQVKETVGYTILPPGLEGGRICFNAIQIF